MNDETSNSNDVIEISDDSCEAVYDGAGASSSGFSSLKRKPFYNDENDGDTDDTDESDDVQFIEEESESEPDYECDLWDDDCVVLSKSVHTKLIQGIHHTKFISIPEPADIKRIKLSVELNNNLNNDLTLKTIQENYLNDNAFEEKHCELITDPWKVLIVNNLIEDPAILDQIRQEFNDLDWNIRIMDLYEFNQSEDLKNIHQENISMMHEFLKGDLMSWVAKITGLELVTVSATCSFYSDTDFLLVHDDQRGTRAVAFVLYLTGKEGWCVDWGGCLQLLNADEDRQPLKVARDIQPRNNQLVLFPVSDRSYHQVEEVQCKNFCRLSINGWFHTKEPLTFEAPLCKPIPDGLYGVETFEPCDVTDITLADYIDEGYLVEETISSIQKYIEEHSEMSLEVYFNEAVLASVLTDLQSKEIKWQKMGPPNQRNYEYIAADNNLPPKLSKFLTLLRSKQFVAYLNQYTGLELKKMKWELQKWTPGSYSLITQTNVDRLDIMFCMGDTAHVVGGKTHYVTLEDEIQTALITTGCDVNYVNLVYGDTARYTALVSKYSGAETEYYMFVASYYEDNDNNIEDDVLHEDQDVVDLEEDSIKETSSELDEKQDQQDVSAPPE